MLATRVCSYLIRLKKRQIYQPPFLLRRVISNVCPELVSTVSLLSPPMDWIRRIDPPVILNSTNKENENVDRDKNNSQAKSRLRKTLKETGFVYLLVPCWYNRSLRRGSICRFFQPELLHESDCMAPV